MKNHLQRAPGVATARQPARGRQALGGLQKPCLLSRNLGKAIKALQECSGLVQ